jgi:hypothetical protein
VAQAVSAGLAVAGLGTRQLKGYERQVPVYALALQGPGEASDNVIRLVKD